MGERTPAQLYALVFGAVLLLVGILGFFIEGGTNFGVGESAASPTGQLLGIFEINGWHNVVHLASGAIGLAMAGTPSSARIFALGFGVVYALVTVVGLVLDSPVLGLIPINGPDNILHLLIAALGIAAGLASPREPAPTTA